MSKSVSKPKFTLTFGDSAENHVGMEKIGTMVKKGEGFSVEELRVIQARFEAAGGVCELVHIEQDKTGPAAVLVMRGGVDVMLGAGAHAALCEEQKALKKDKHALFRGVVKNKLARFNLCFAETGHDADYAKGMGTVVAYKDVPYTDSLKKGIETWIGPKGVGLQCEGNYYETPDTQGIGFHGDSERRKVVAVRLGEHDEDAALEMPIHFQCFYYSEPVGERVVIPLKGGDMYVMSEKAVGTDWKCRSMYTFRHATGKKYVVIKKKAEKAEKAEKSEKVSPIVAAFKAMGGGGGPS